MQQHIEWLLEGKFEYEKGNLEFDCPKLELSLRRGEIFEGTFAIQGDKRHLTEGKVYSSCLRMRVLNPVFVGNGESITYQFDSGGMEEGDVIKGEFDVVSNQGEYYLPFVVTIEHSVLDSSLGPVKNLFHFANLAKSSWAEAVSLFYCPDFPQVFAGNDRQYLELYRGLSVNRGNERNVDEFLIAIKKKQRIEYLVEKTSVSMEDPGERIRSTIMVTRNGWGYTELTVEAEGAFLETEKSRLTDDDFLGNYCQLEYYINPQELHFGKNFGKLRLHSAFFENEVTVEVYRSREDKSVLLRHHTYSYSIYQLMVFYQQFRLKKINRSVWLTETKRLVEKLSDLGDGDVSVKLFEAQLLITAERNNEAKWLLDRIEEQLDGREVPPEIACYYLYLTSLNSREEAYVDEVADQVEQIFGQYRDNWRIAWLMLYLSENYSKSASKKWFFLEEQFERGCNSPILYIEAVLLVQADPALLTQMGRFEIHVLCYAVKEQMLTVDLVRQILSLAASMKEFDSLVLRILEACYEFRESTEALQVICSHLIKGNRTGHKYFEWYRRGVEKEIRVTRLYEYFMLSMDLAFEEEIPKLVMLYFSYQNELDYERSARLYAQIVKKKKSYPEVYSGYSEQIERFVLEQIDLGHINRDLAYLYQNMVTPQMLRQDNADAFSSLLFVNLFTTSYEKAAAIVVRHFNLEREYRYPVVRGVGYAPIYSGEYAVLFEDLEGNRFCASIPYHTEKLMLSGKLAKYVAPYAKDSIAFALYMCENGHSSSAINEDNLGFYERVARDAAVRARYRSQIALKLLRYYYEKDCMQELDKLLKEIGPEQLSASERTEVLHFLVKRGSFDRAYEWCVRFGVENVDAKLLQRLCSSLIEREDFEPGEEMTQFAFLALQRGKADRITLEYLGVHYEGLAKRLRDIWRRSMEQGLDCAVLEERVLSQLLYSGAYIGERQEIFRHYVEGEPDEALREALVARCSYDYFVREKVMSPFLFEQIGRLWQERGQIQKICKLAYTKYYAVESKGRTESLTPILRTFLSDLIDEGIFLSYFSEYVELHPAIGFLFDRTIIEHRTNPGCRVSIHYLIEKDDSEEEEYTVEEMRMVFDGVFVKEFILFFGESVQYYITEERDGSGKLTHSATVRKSDIGREVVESRFGRINDLVVSQTLQDYSTLDTMLEEYYQTDYYTNHLFRLL